MTPSLERSRVGKSEPVSHDGRVANSLIGGRCARSSGGSAVSSLRGGGLALEQPSADESEAFPGKRAIVLEELAIDKPDPCLDSDCEERLSRSRLSQNGYGKFDNIWTLLIALSSASSSN